MEERDEPSSVSSGSTVNLSKSEEREANRRAGLRAAVVFESVRREGEGELARPPIALAFSGLGSGFSMTLSLMVTGMIRTLLPDAIWTPLIENLGYTVGFLATVLGRQQLFTENTVTAVIPVLDDFTNRTKWVRLARLWSVVLITNLLGTTLVAFALADTDIFHPGVKHSFLQLGLAAMAGTPLTTFLRALLAGWLIALMVWLLPAAEGARVLVIGIITYVVGLGGFAHVIAGSAEVLYAVARNAVSWHDYLLRFLLPTFAGNSLGGVILVSLLNYAQVAVKSEEEQPGGS